jgi:hypothetical protein
MSIVSCNGWSPYAVVGEKSLKIGSESQNILEFRVICLFQELKFRASLITWKEIDKS